MDDPGRPSIASGPPVPVVDKTGLQGIFDINVRSETGDRAWICTRSGSACCGINSGCRLESRKAKVDVLVVDGAERIPTAN